MLSQDQGYIVTKSGQDCVYCVACNRHQYNAPKHGLGKRTLPGWLLKGILLAQTEDHT